MAKNTLPTNYVDDIMNVSANGNRKYRMIYNDDGTVSFEDVTLYEQVGSDYSAIDINTTNEAVNESFDKNKIVPDLTTINALTEQGYVPDALAVKQLSESLCVLKNIDSQLSFTQPTRTGFEVTSMRAWTLGTLCNVSLTITSTVEWAQSTDIDISTEGFPARRFTEWKMGSIVGANIVGATMGANGLIRLRNLGSSAIKAGTYGINFAYHHTEV